MPPILLRCSDNGDFPGNRLPVIHYKQALRLPLFFKGRFVKRLFAHHQWSNAWKSGIFTYSHYHSTSHEVLGFISGRTSVLLGGSNGHTIEVEEGDVLIIPAGVAHKNLGSEYQVKCIGAYPDGRDYDINTGQRGERPQTDYNIMALPLPTEDPIFGPHNGLPKIWARILQETD